MQHRGQASHTMARPVQPSAEPPRATDVASRLHRAAYGLLERRREFSAGATLWRWQKWTCLTAVATLLAGSAIMPRQTLALLLAILAFPFLCVVILRGMALFTLVTQPSVTPEQPRQPDASLPHYCVLVPLFRETPVIPGLIRALAAIDYPTDRLEIFLVLESIDHDTRAAIAKCTLPAHMAVVVVPDGAPRTKPRALNYALQEATGDYVVIYDAEDVPDPGQLRAALAMRLKVLPSADTQAAYAELAAPRP